MCIMHTANVHRLKLARTARIGTVSLCSLGLTAPSVLCGLPQRSGSKHYRGTLPAACLNSSSDYADGVSAKHSSLYERFSDRQSGALWAQELDGLPRGTGGTHQHCDPGPGGRRSSKLGSVALIRRRKKSCGRSLASG